MDAFRNVEVTVNPCRKVHHMDAFRNVAFTVNPCRNFGSAAPQHSVLQLFLTFLIITVGPLVTVVT